jgi:hypothetical protein
VSEPRLFSFHLVPDSFLNYIDTEIRNKPQHNNTIVVHESQVIGCLIYVSSFKQDFLRVLLFQYRFWRVKYRGKFIIWAERRYGYNPTSEHGAIKINLHIGNVRWGICLYMVIKYFAWRLNPPPQGSNGDVMMRRVWSDVRLVIC